MPRNMATTSRPADFLYVFLTICSLPVSLPILILNLIAAHLVWNGTLRQRLRRSAHFPSRRILISGISTPQGLRLARAFYEAGHDVVGADFEPDMVPTHGRTSRVISRFYRLNSQGRYGGTPYAHDLVQIVKGEKIDVWISCSEHLTPMGEAWATKIVREKTRCRCFLLESDIAAKSTSPDEFLAYVQSLDLPTPERRLVKSRTEVHNILNESSGKRRYTLHATGDTSPPESQSVFPRRTRSQTYHEVSKLHITQTAPFVLEEYVEGLERYTTIAIVVDGDIKAFAAGLVSSDADSQSTQVPASSTFQSAMLLFVKAFVERTTSGSGGPSSYHLSMDFCIEDAITERGIEKIILPVAGQFQPNSALSLFQGLQGSLSLSRAYLSSSAPTKNGSSQIARRGNVEGDEVISTPSPDAKGVYLLVPTFMQLVLKPLLQFLAFQKRPISFYTDLWMFLSYLIWWQEGNYEFWDPLPLWWLINVTTPLNLLLRVLRSGNQGTSKRLSG